MSVGPLFDQLEESKRKLCQARRHRYGRCPEDQDLWLAQLARVAADVGMQNPFPSPRRHVWLVDHACDLEVSHG